MRKLYMGVIVLLFSYNTSFSQTCTSIANNTAGNPKGWLEPSNWSCGGGASTTVNGLWPNGTSIIIDRDFSIENDLVDLTTSGIEIITITSTGNLIFSSNAQLLLPAGTQIIFESGAQVTANNNASGSLIEIAGNGVWGNACNGCSNQTLTGPGTIDENSDPNAPLPIELLSFKGFTSNGKVNLEWSTASEENNDYFSIEKSLDGVNYDLITTVNGAGNSSQILEYSYTDNNPSFGKSYYRLKQTDFDGTSETFAPVAVEYTSLEEGKLSFTNPVNPGESVSILTNAEDSEVLTLSIINVLGESIVSKSFTGSQYDLRLSNDMKPGMYFVKVYSKTTERSGRLIIQ